VHLGDQRAGRVDHRQVPRRGVVVHRGCVRARRTRPARPPARPARHRRRPRPLASRVGDDGSGCGLRSPPHVYRGPVPAQRALHRVDGALDARAVTARKGEENVFHQVMVEGDRPSR
jgi:hypothetical protein